MNEVVLDASAVLAIVFDEPGKDRLTAEILDRSVVSTVNLAEVQTKLIKKGFESEEAWWAAVHLVVAVEPFTADHARIAGDLIATLKGMACRWGTGPAWRWRLRSRLRSTPPNRFGET